LTFVVIGGLKEITGQTAGTEAALDQK